MRTEPIALEMTPRIEREAQRWQRGGLRPPAIAAVSIGQESVWDYPRPPALQRVLDRVVVELNGRVIVETVGAIRVCETASPPTYYLPRRDFQPEVLVPAAGESYCEWKGVATYWSLQASGRIVPGAAWSYEAPHSEYAVLAGAIALYPGRVDRCSVGASTVRAQPGGFYGGWITDDLVGPFKGEPGSQGW